MSRIALVTGATFGIGRVISQRLALDGYHVIGLGRSHVTDFPGTLERVDLADEAATAQTLERVLAEHDVGFLVNNVALSKVEALEDFDFGAFRAMLEINLRAAAQCAKACASGMSKRGFGRIVNIGSVGLKGGSRTSAYGATKAALRSMTVSWALELADKGVTVNMVAPGAIDLGMFPRNNPPGSPRREAMLAAIPMGRLGSPEDVAATVAFFLSKEASYVTGQTLFVCGGWSVRN